MFLTQNQMIWIEFEGWPSHTPEHWVPLLVWGNVFHLVHHGVTYSRLGQLKRNPMAESGNEPTKFRLAA
jgi:hypothetical protein